MTYKVASNLTRLWDRNMNDNKARNRTQFMQENYHIQIGIGSLIQKAPNDANTNKNP
jgi:hypothetical protein